MRRHFDASIEEIIVGHEKNAPRAIARIEPVEQSIPEGVECVCVCLWFIRV